MTLIRSKPSGYGVHDKVTGVQAEIIDSQLPNAADWINGGTYNIVNDITLASPSKIFHVQIPTLVEGTGALQVASCFTALPSIGKTTFDGDAEFQGDVSVTSGDWTFGAASSLSVTGGAPLVVQGGALSISAGGTFNTIAGCVMNIAGNVNVAGTSDWAFLGTIYFTQAPSLQAGATVSGALTLSGAGHIIYRRASGVDADHTYSVADADIVRIPNVSSLRLYKLDTAGASDGDVIEFYVIPADTTNITEIQRLDATPLLDMKNASGYAIWGRFIYSSVISNWEVVGWTKV